MWVLKAVASHVSNLFLSECRFILQTALREEQQQHASLAASLQDMAAGLHSSGDAEGQLRAQLMQLAEHVAVLTAAQVG